MPKCVLRDEETPTSTWKSLRETWKDYGIAKFICNVDQMKLCARRIKGIQSQLGVPTAKFGFLTDLDDDKVSETDYVWGSLRAAWAGYGIAKDKGNKEQMKTCAERINEVQDQLGVPKSKFSILEEEGQIVRS